ncbi:MAG TPA: AmmeMemoRadiSam system radical SAM enzyme [Anaerolineae bacterium]|nr:AmmeMemoRadiSam system radical SAM enzyme [Anaerolineae bacterium]
MIDSMFVRESLLQEKTDGKVRCHVCERRCTIGAGGAGWCRTRENRSGRLVTLIYGAASSIAVNPIEKKPFYHFYPGTLTLTAGSWSCNFGCPWCQNWDISKTPPPRAGEYVSPERFVELAENYTCQGTSISFNEPTLSLEWSLDVFRLARGRGLYNTYVTNGYMTPEALSLLIDAGLDAMNVDVKGDAVAVRKYGKGIDVDKVWAVCRLARSGSVHIEITTLVIPTVNDSDAALRSIAERMVNDLGPDVPWHVTGYYPAYKFTAPPTSIRTLERAWHIGKDAGLEFVYVGNVPGHRFDNTYCPTCDTLLLRRRGFDVLHNAVRRGRCPHCERPIAGVWGEE